MGRTWLARTALATAALGISAAGVLAVPAASAGATGLTTNQKIATYAKTLEGVRYVYGGTSLAGFDCSGMTQYAYRHSGKLIQRTANAQFHEFRRITHAAARPGDLVFFHVSTNPSSYVYHVGIFEGGTNTVIASTGAGRVVWQSYTWAGNTVTFGTITH